jgi:hypothetical protein
MLTDQPDSSPGGFAIQVGLLSEPSLHADGFNDKPEHGPHWYRIPSLSGAPMATVLLSGILTEKPD